MMDDTLLGENVFRLQPQYDASGFLQACPLNEQYRILASICRSENYLTSEQREGNIPSILYTTRLLAYSAGCGKQAAPLSMLRELQQRRRKEEEDREEKQAVCIGTVEEEEEAAAEEETGEHEVWYNEEEGYYYDEKGYYDDEGNYYYFAESLEEVQETEENAGEMQACTSEEVQEMDVEHEALCGAENEAPWCNMDPFEEGKEEQGATAGDEAAEIAQRLRVVPDDSHWAVSPFVGGVSAPHRAAKQLEQSLPQVDAFLQKSGAIPSLPVSGVTGLYSAVEEEKEEGDSVAVCSTCIHVLASMEHLHVVYVPSSCDSWQQDEKKEERIKQSDDLEWFPEGSPRAGVLMSIPLHSADTQSQSTFYGYLGDGRLLLEVYAAAAGVAPAPEDGITVSLILGIPPDALFRGLPSGALLVECYERRVLHHMAKAGALLEESVVAEFGNADKIALCTQVSQSLFSYSVLLMGKAGRNDDVVRDFVYSEASNALLHATEHEEAARLAQAREDVLYMACSMEAPRQRYLREALAALQRTEAEERGALDAAAMSKYQVDHQHSFHIIAFLGLPLLLEHDASAFRLLEEERWQWECLMEQFSIHCKKLISEETRRRLGDQFSFERRLRAVQCSVCFDVLLARETAARAQLERDEAVVRHEGKLLECYITLLACGRVEEFLRRLDRVDKRDVRGMAESNFDGERRSVGLIDVMACPGDALVRCASHSQESQHPQRHSSSQSSLSPTTEEFMRVVADGYRGASYALSRPPPPRWAHHHSNSVSRKLCVVAKADER